MEVEPSPDDAAALMAEDELPSICSMCGVTEAEWMANEREEKLYRDIADKQSWFVSDATGEERCGRCHYEDSNEHLFDEADDDDDDDDGAEGKGLRDAASDSDEFSSDGEEQEM